MAKQRDRELVSERPSRRYLEDDPNWMEHLDPTPVEVPTRLRVPGNQVARIRALIQREMSERAAAVGAESFEESDDFELEDEEWVSPYEEVFEPPLVQSPVRDGPAIKEKGSGRRSEAVGSGEEADSVGARSGDKGAGKAGGASGGVAGSGGGVGGAGARSEGSESES